MAHAEVPDALPVHATADRAIAEFAVQPSGQDVPFAVTGLDEEPYAADPAFAGGQYFLDDFWANPASPTNFFQGRKVARLSNGDIVVAAMVKNPNGNQTNGLWNIGLVRYNAAGTQRVPWSNGGIYAHVDGEYIVYPKINDAAVGWIQDIRVTGDKILVAFQWHFAGTDDIDTRVLVFGQDGSYKSNTGVFVSSMAEYVGGMTTYNVGFPGTTSVVVVAMRAPRESAGGGQGRPIFRRYTLNNDGTLTEATGVVDLNTHWCADTSRDCRPAGIALGTRGAGEPPAIFVVNRAFNPGASPQRWGFTVTKVNGNGVEQSGWSSHWRNYDPDGVADPSNWAAAVAVRTTGFGTPQSPYQDHVFVTAEVARRCGNGAVVARYNHAGDYFATSHVLFGGSSATPALCALAGHPTDLPRHMAISGERLAVVGRGSHTGTSGSGPLDLYYGSVAILDISHPNGLSLSDLRDYPYPISGSATSRDSSLWGIVPTTAGKFVVVGDARYRNISSVDPSLRGKNSVATLGIAPDRIFGNGLE